MNKIRHLSLISLIVSTHLIGCNNSKFQLRQLETGARETLLCEQNFDDFNNHIYDFWLNKTTLPSSNEFKKYFLEGLQNDPAWSKTSNETLSQIVDSTTRYYQFVANDLTQSADTPEAKLKLLTSLELGDTEEQNEALQLAWTNAKEQLQSKLQRLDLPCEEVKRRIHETKLSQTLPDSGSDFYTSKLPRVVEGLRRSFATAYQSCSTLEIPALTERSTPVEGIRILSKPHADGIGRKRVYGDVKKIVETHPYYFTGPLEKGCIDSRKKPLIYDYGGKPQTTSSPDSTLDFFNDEGSGTSVLGIDCSGFIFSAIARGGLKLAPNKTLKAVSVHGVSARMFKEPVKNGLICFSPIEIKSMNSLKPGDIIASQGHVVMVDQVGNDPFGIRKARTLSDCNENVISVESFDFIIAHSSPWKDGVGINRSVARDYLQEPGTIRTGLLKYALAFCRAQFNTKPPPSKVADISVIRHKGTSECLAPKPITLEHESCVQKCNYDQPLLVN